ncbi:MAG: DEAD/DEAH box helicase, partial [Armatimonadetes bacterium]|nr:DEAD/DEAH box helicase [Armatimonadota bacterium]
VLASFRIMEEHFALLYDNVPCKPIVYDSKQPTRLRSFATANTLQVLVLNIQAFDKASTIMQKDNDGLSGRRPIEFLQATCPIVIMDEPQNMESPAAKKAIASLNPLCTLRYSATHRNRYHLVYRLGPVKAYDLRLVKKIVVNSVVEEGDFNRPFIGLESITATKTRVTAKVKLDIQAATGVVRKTVTVSGDEDLYEKSGEREVYKGYVIEDIDAEFGFIRFTNGTRIEQGEEQGSNRESVMKTQVREAIREHFEKELAIHRTLPEGKRLKVLSLFFIDRVANYAPSDGKIRLWFEEFYQQFAQRPEYARLNPPPIAKVHDGYFAEDKGVAKDSQEGRDTQADDSAYKKIMQAKEQLLSMEEPLRFIFSHSALREGWDNPNVFQICTLNETRSEVKKRQEIGRGLRLPVDQTGNRVFDPIINRLTVIANEHYEDFSKQLQKEIKEETGEDFTGRIENKRERRAANLVPSWRSNPDFVALWERIQAKTRYVVTYSTEALIAKAAEYVSQMGTISPPAILIQSRLVEMSEEGISGRLLKAKEERADYGNATLPDIIGYLQRETHLTRYTLVEVLKRSRRLGDAPKNPQAFLERAVHAIKRARQELMVSGIKYQRLEGSDSVWDM